VSLRETIVMVRIIYHIPELGYRVLDRDKHEEILRLEPSLKNANASIVCIIDFKNKLVTNKSSDFIEHRERMDDVLFDQDYIQL
jgi:hypothetical protein